MRRTHDVPLMVKAANLARYFPPWTVTREQWWSMTHASISGVAIVVQPYWVSIVSRLSDHQSYRNSCGFPGDVHATVTCLSGGIGYGSGESAASPMRQRSCGTDVAVISSGRMFLLDPQSVVGLSPGPGDLDNRGGGGDYSMRLESGCLLPSEASTVQALMDLALPRFAGLGDGPRQVHLPWSVSSNSSASPAACRLDSSEQEDIRFQRDQMPVSSPCLNLDEMSSLDDDTKESVGLSDLSITLLCDSEVITPVDSDQVLSNVDLPLESVVNDKRQVIRIRDVSPDVLLVDDSQVGQAGDSHRPVMRIASGKRMPGKVSTAISRAPLSLDMTVKCTAGVATTAAQPPAVTSHPAIGMATVTSKEAEISTGASDVAPVRMLEQDSVLVGEGVPAVAHSSPPLFESPDPVPVAESGPPDVELPSSPSSGQSSSISSQTLAWEDAGDSSVPLSPNRVQEGLSQDVPDEGSLFNVSPISPEFLFRPSAASVGWATVANDVGRYQRFGSWCTDYVCTM